MDPEVHENLSFFFLFPLYFGENISPFILGKLFYLLCCRVRPLNLTQPLIPRTTIPMMHQFEQTLWSPLSILHFKVALPTTPPFDIQDLYQRVNKERILKTDRLGLPDKL